MTLDARALEQLYRTHAAMVFRRARTLLHDDEEAQDAVHEIFMSLVKKPEQFAGRSSIATFLYSMTTNFCLKRIRDQTNRARLIDLHVAPRVQTERGPTGEHRAVLVDLLRRVPLELAEVAVYYYLDEMSHEEIGETLGCSRKHVGNQLERFRAQAEKLIRPTQGDAA